MSEVCDYEDDTLDVFIVALEDADAMIILRHVAEIDVLSDDMLKNADVSSDNKVNTFDAAMVLSHVAGLI